MNRPVAHPGARQSGVSLVIVLILLLVMTILGLAVMRGTLLEERMSANMYDRSLAFQQAESALREAEAAVRASVLANGKGWVVGVRCGEDPEVAALTEATRLESLARQIDETEKEVDARDSAAGGPR